MVTVTRSSDADVKIRVKSSSLSDIGRLIGCGASCSLNEMNLLNIIVALSFRV